MTKILKYILPLLSVLIFCTVSCNKEIDKKDFRFPLMGSYQCNIKLYGVGCGYSTITLLLDTNLIEEVIPYEDSSFLFRVQLSQIYSQKYYPFDTASFSYISSLIINHPGVAFESTNPNRGRDILGYINGDTLHYFVGEGCLVTVGDPRYIFEISGKKIRY